MSREEITQGCQPDPLSTLLFRAREKSKMESEVSLRVCPGRIGVTQAQETAEEGRRIRRGRGGFSLTSDAQPPAPGPNKGKRQEASGPGRQVCLNGDRPGPAGHVIGGRVAGRVKKKGAGLKSKKRNVGDVEGQSAKAGKAPPLGRFVDRPLEMRI